MTNQSTTLPLKRIVLALFYFLLVPILTPLISLLIQNQLISYTFTVSLSGLLLLIQNWDLLEIHAKRFKDEYKESIFFTVFGTLLIALIVWINNTYFHAYLPHLNKLILKDFSWFIVPILIINTLVFAMNYVVVFKSVTDRLKLKHAEMVIILLSAFIFALLFTVTYIPFDIIEWSKGYLFYFIITLTISYLYNQTHSFFPGMIGFGLTLLIYNILFIFM